MASGKRAFRGESSVETMNAILKEDVPELSESGPQVSPGLDRIVRRCLEKKPERRFQSASDLAFALEALSGSSSVARSASAAVSASVPVARTNRRMWIIAAVAALAIAAAAIWFYPRSNSFPGTFTQMTFRSAYIRNARFAAGKTVVYGASVYGQPMQILSTRTDTFESQPLNIQADMLGISPNSEMAVSLDRNFETLWVPTGRLAKAPLGGGATRELLDDVTDADWNKDGSDLAVARRVGGQFRLEYPPGKVLYQTTGYISDLRFSPAGDQIAFLDHPFFGDDRGNVSLVDLGGHRKVLAGEFSSEQGLAWTPKGNEVWFTANENGEPSSLRAVDLRGRRRIIIAAPVRMHLQDIAPDGRVLLSAELLRWQVGIADKNGSQRDMTAFQWPEIEAISADGSMILLNSFDISLDANYRLYVQRTNDGSLPVQIGEGAGASLSADLKWAAAIDPTHPQNLLVIPTGVGETRTLHAPEGRHYQGASLLPDGQRILISTVGSTGSPQTALQDIETGSIHPVGSTDHFIPTTVGLVFPGVSLDGKFCILTNGKNQYWLQPLDGSAGRDIHGISKGEVILQWHGDSNNVFVSRPVGSEIEIYTVNLTTGERKPWTRFTPADKTAIAGHGSVIITPDGTHYAYMVQRIYSTLFLADGLR